MDITRLPSALYEIDTIVKNSGHKVYLVGGAVRDLLLGLSPKDFDLATSATPQEVMALFHHVIPTGIAHGTVTVLYRGYSMEFTTFRTEGSYSDARHPDSVAYSTSIEEDLSRRDFTINALAYDLATGELIDPYKGALDLRARLIRAVGDPIARFSEDGLRPIRALRFRATLDFDIEPLTLEALKSPAVLAKVFTISMERLRDELVKVLASREPSLFFTLMEECGILEHFFIELSVCRTCSQVDSRGYHNLDVLGHCLKACDMAPSTKLYVRLAALLHDIGKNKTRVERVVEGRTIVSFYKHELYSVQLASTLLKRLRFSNSDIKHVCHLIECHMFCYESTWSNASVRRFVARVGEEYIEELLELSRADALGKAGSTDASAIDLRLGKLRSRIAKQKSLASAFSLKDLAINGKDLMELGLVSGPKVGAILKALLNLVLEDPLLNTRATLRERALALIAKGEV